MNGTRSRLDACPAAAPPAGRSATCHDIGLVPPRLHTGWAPETSGSAASIVCLQVELAADHRAMAASPACREIRLVPAPCPIRSAPGTRRKAEASACRHPELAAGLPTAAALPACREIRLVPACLHSGLAAETSGGSLGSACRENGLAPTCRAGRLVAGEARPTAAGRGQVGVAR